ncbi:MAG: hypothetical protein H8D67_27575 [Deltaproteobacteria bacterium]|nr:hypothetical protein [Deltaproteobacteria bacterium]
MQQEHTKNHLTELQSAAVEVYREQLAENFPEIEILDAFATDGIIEVRLNYSAIRDYQTLNRTTQLAIEVEELFGVTLLPYIVPHER